MRIIKPVVTIKFYKVFRNSLVFCTEKKETNYIVKYKEEYREASKIKM